MSWFRSKRGVVTWLALFALACQLVISFGHVHFAKAGGYADISTVGADAGDNSPDLAPAPHHKNPAGIADDFCAICASIQSGEHAGRSDVTGGRAAGSFRQAFVVVARSR